MHLLSNERIGDRPRITPWPPEAKARTAIVCPDSGGRAMCLVWGRAKTRFLSCPRVWAARKPTWVVNVGSGKGLECGAKVTIIRGYVPRLPPLCILINSELVCLVQLLCVCVFMSLVSSEC